MDDFLPISALQHYFYCPRQFALIHVERAWEENRYTAEGRVLHERVDSGAAEQRGKARYERSVLLRSDLLRLTGKLDLLESYEGKSLVPVEYKRGKPKLEAWDWVQVCAQALCIEEMRGSRVDEGAIWYWEVRRRETIAIDEALRSETLSIVESCHEIMKKGETPRPEVDKKRCRACSLKNLCRPDQFRRDRSKHYVRALFEP